MSITSNWSPSSWRQCPAAQQPSWPDAAALDSTVRQLRLLPALVFAGETRKLKDGLAEAARGRALVLQAGDCAEEFSRCNGPSIHALLRVILQMAIVLAYAGERRVIKIGRLAGQYAKPRSSDVELVDGLMLPSYRGDMVNRPERTLEARVPDPVRMLDGYFRSTATLNLIRAFTSGGYGSLERVYAWSTESKDQEFVGAVRYEALVAGIRKAMDFMRAIGVGDSSPIIEQTVLYTSHEALLLDYEEAMTRVDTTTGDWYDTSAHMLWIGDRTRQPGGAHVELLRGVCNPIGLKVGPTVDLDELVRVILSLNPDNQPGRISLIARLGSERVHTMLPPLVKRIQAEGLLVTWLCDPMHGNTFTTVGGRKSRNYDDIVSEIRTFWQVHRAEGSVPAGVHLELTGDPVTECVGGAQRLGPSDLSKNYQTVCDPRLNSEQAVELAFELAEIIHP